MNFISDQVKSLQYFSILCVFSVVGLLTIWVLPNTIALRHVFIGIGLISAIVVIVKTKFFKGRGLLEMAPLILFSLIFIWAITHYFLFSLNPDLELQELKSIWLRALAGSIIAIGLSIALRINTFLRPYFFISLFVVSAINLSAYLYLSYKSGSFILPADFVTAFVFKKIEAAFFGVIAISIGCANLLYLISKQFDKKNIFIILFWFFGIIIAIISSVVANTKNGVAVALGLCLIFALTILFKALINKSQSNLSLLIIAFSVLLLLFSGWKVHSKFASQGWGTLLEDARISSQIEKHNFWRYNGQNWHKVVGENFPKNSLGINVAGNTYERVAWATEGIILVSQYPMGYGSINRSFVGMLNHAKVPQELESQTHSGWIDFGLAFGLPGILILFTTFISIVCKGLYSPHQFGLMGVWLILGFIPFGIIAEICYKHNFEILIFFIAFAATSVVGMRRIKAEN
jgi:hypothetical protein